MINQYSFFIWGLCHSIYNSLYLFCKHLFYRHFRWSQTILYFLRSRLFQLAYKMLGEDSEYNHCVFIAYSSHSQDAFQIKELFHFDLPYLPIWWLDGSSTMLSKALESILSSCLGCCFFLCIEQVYKDI